MKLKVQFITSMGGWVIKERSTFTRWKILGEITSKADRVRFNNYPSHPAVIYSCIAAALEEIARHPLMHQYCNISIDWGDFE